MAFTNLVTSELDLDAIGTGSVNTSHVAGTINFVVVEVANGADDPGITVQYGGQTLTRLATARHGWFGSGDCRVSVYAIAAGDGDTIPQGTQTFQVTTSGNLDYGKARIWTGQASTPQVVGIGSDSGLNHNASWSYDSGDNLAMAFVALTSGSVSWPGVSTVVGSVTCETQHSQYDNAYGKTSGGGLCRETPEDTDGHSASTGYVTVSGIAGLAIVEGIPAITGHPIDLTLELVNGALGTSGVAILGAGLPELEIEIGHGRIGKTGPRQLHLVGEGVETPEMTEDGDEGDTIIRHTDRPPTWEPANSHNHDYYWAPAVWRPDPVSAPDDWEILHSDDGSVMMVKIFDE